MFASGRRRARSRLRHPTAGLLELPDLLEELGRLQGNAERRLATTFGVWDDGFVEGVREARAHVQAFVDEQLERRHRATR